jgi:hypothetical protein
MHRAESQNLVQNPSFEEHTEIPLTAGQLNFCNEWFNPNGYYVSLDSSTVLQKGSPDYFYYNNGMFGPVWLPNTLQGSLYAHSGLAIAGLIAAREPSYGNIREYIYSQLLDPLLKEKQYEVSLYIHSGSLYGGGIDKFGIAFSTIPLIQDSFEVINFQPQLVYDTILYTTEWKKIEFEFMADSNYQYLTLGNFYNDEETTSMTFNPCGGNCGTYYFIDDVSVTIKDVDGINENEVVQINIYPNPALEKIKINSEITVDKWMIFDLSSKLIAQNNLNNKRSFEIDVSFLNAGVYYICLETSKGSTVKKIIKQNL